MHILLSNNFYYPNTLGGAEISSQTLGEVFAERGHSVRMLCLSGTEKTERFTHNGVDVVALGRKLLGAGPTSEKRSSIGRLAWHLSAATDFGWENTLRDVIREQPTDIVNCFNLAGTTTQLWSAVKSLDLPLVHTLFGTYLVCYRGPMFKNGKDCGVQCNSCRTLTKRRKVDSALVDAVVGDSAAVLNRHLQHDYFPGVSERNVINCGFRNAQISTEERAPNTSGKLRIGFLGRLHPTKGLNVLLEACEALQVDDWVLKIGGSGTPEKEEELRNHPSPNIEFLGWQNAAEFLSGVDVMVVPSIWNDPLPRVVFESLCAGVPVIGSRIGGIPEMIEQDVTGALVEPGAVNELRDALTKFIVAPDCAPQMREACLSRAGHFTADRFADEYLALYARLLGRGVDGQSQSRSHV